MAGDASESTQVALAALVSEQRRLRGLLAGLDARIAMLERRLAEPREEAPIQAPPAAALDAMPAPTRAAMPPPLPIHEIPSLSTLPAVSRAPIEFSTPVLAATPPALPPPLPPADHGSLVDRKMAPPAPAATPPPIRPPDDSSSWEMIIGGTWLVRVGIVALLTSLVLLATYLYENGHIGALGKVGLLYLAAGAITGLGAWLERLSRENAGLRRYALVVFGGGLAAIYYVTYAAYYVEALRVIPSALLAGLLLLGWTGFMVWLADRRESETLATFAILLAYYTSAVNQVGGFTLFSNLALAVAAVYLLRRHRWAAFSFASLLATYGSYAFWRMAENSPVPVDAQVFWTDSAFLTLYWSLFTGCALFVRKAMLPPGRKAVFVTLNNGALFLLVGSLAHACYPGHFWLWAAGFGTVLCVLGSRRLWERVGPAVEIDAATAAAYRLLGIVLITTGLITYLSGWHLTLALAMETAILVLAAGSVPSTLEQRLLMGPAYVVAALAFSQAVMGGEQIAQGLAIGGAFVFSAFWVQRLLNAGEEASGKPPLPRFADSWLRPGPAYFSLLGLLVWLDLLNSQITHEHEVFYAPALACAALLLTASAYPLRIRAVALIVQLYLLCALVTWLGDYRPLDSEGLRPLPVPWWNPFILIGAAVALDQWWQRQQRFAWRPVVRGGVQLGDALTAGIVLYAWLKPLFPSSTWMALSSLLAVAILAGAWAAGSWSLGLASQIFLIAAVVRFFGETVMRPREHRLLALLPLLALLSTHILGRRIAEASKWPFGGGPSASSSQGVARIYECLVLLMVIAWIFGETSNKVRFTCFTLAGALLLAFGVWRREPRWLGYSVVLTVIGLGVYWLPEAASAEDIQLDAANFSWIHLLGFAVLGAEQQLGHRWRPGAVPFPKWAQTGLIVAAGLGVWRWLTDALQVLGGGSFSLAFAWSLLAAVLFAVGLALRERVYRWLGLGLLAVTLGRIIVVDFWEADTLHRVFSLFALGAVLLVLGFVYNRFQARLRKWL